MDIGRKEINLAPYGEDTNGVPYTANPTQQKVLDWVDQVRAGKHPKSGIPTLLLRGGVGSGKTRGIMAPVLELLFECPGIRMLWGRQDLKDLKLSVMDKFFEILPPDALVKKSEQYNWYDVMTEDPKKPSRIYFNGLKDLSGFGSQEFAIVVITEAHETTEMAYRTLKRRCRQVGYPVMILMESEPPNEGHWLERLTNPSSDEIDPDIEVWELTTYENWANLPEAYKQSLESMPKAWQRKYLYGKAGFIPDGRPFYEGFRSEIHCGDFTYNTQKEMIGSFDFGFHHPAFVVAQFDLMGRINFLAELMGNEITIDKFCDQVRAFINLNFPNAPMWYFYGDPACMQVNDKSEKTSWKICKDKGFDIKIKTSTYRERKEIIDARLSKMISGKPMFRVDNKCRILVDGMLGGYHYPERKPGQANSENFEAPFRDGYYEHICNAMEYLCVNTMKIDTVSSSRERQKLYRSANRSSIKNAGFAFRR